MKHLITDIQRFSLNDGPGIRTSVFLKGCPLRCVWCHNPESIAFGRSFGFYQDKCLSCGSCQAVCSRQAVRMENGIPVTDRERCAGCFDCTAMCPGDARIGYGEVWEADALAEKLAQDKPFFDNGGGVTLSGGECLLQADFASEVAKILCEKGVSVDIDTCGYVSREAFKKVMPYTDVFLYDVKAISRAVHEKCTGKDSTLILDNLKYLSDNGAKIEVRIPYVPTYNDQEIDKIGKYLSTLNIIKVKVLAYHDHARSKYDALGKTDTMPKVKLPTVRDLDGVVAVLKAYGLNAINGALDD